MAQSPAGPQVRFGVIAALKQTTSFFCIDEKLRYYEALCIRGIMVVKHSRRRFLHLAGITAALPAWSRVARAQAYPSRPVRLVVNLAPGGGLDFMSRVVGEYLSRALGQQVVIENKPGAGGMLGVETV